ncbi:MAG: hypothetical protein F4X59_17560 [Holophagales bacterium]|nr:hypothetical protein [Holophagales bacterium]MYC11914.1 hypothetical protein [Holophagales bacterium]
MTFTVRRRVRGGLGAWRWQIISRHVNQEKAAQRMRRVHVRKRIPLRHLRVYAGNRIVVGR